MNESGSTTPSESKAPARRPIRSRDTWWARKVTDRLIALRVTPNSISIAGMIGAIIAGLLLAATNHLAGIPERVCWVTAALLCQFRLLCNLFDGMVAVDSGQASPVGELYNEVPDRVSDVAIFVGLGYASTATPWLGWLSGVFVVFVPYVRMMAVAAGAPNDFCGPMAKPQRMALVTVLACVLTVLPTGWRTMPSSSGFSIAELSLVNLVLLVVVIGSLATALRRLVRAASWLRSHKT